MKQLSDPPKAFDTVLGLITRLAQHGLIHCDFNEFNLMVCIHVFQQKNALTLFDYQTVVMVTFGSSLVHLDTWG